MCTKLEMGWVCEDLIKKIDAPLCSAVSSNNFRKVICNPESQPGMFNNLCKRFAGFKHPETSEGDLLPRIRLMALFLKSGNPGPRTDSSLIFLLARHFLPFFRSWLDISRSQPSRYLHVQSIFLNILTEPAF
jgi:hypothetical protein